MKMRRIPLWVVLVTAILMSCNSIAQQPLNISVQSFENEIAKPGIQLLDVRTAGEYKSGHLKNAFLADWTNSAQFEERVKALDKSKPIYTYCLSGARSSAAAKWLREHGYITYNLDGGIAAWKRAGKPVEEAALVRQMTLEEYQSLIPNGEIVLVDVGAVWCPPCKKMNPIIDSLAGVKNLKFHLLKIDGGDQADISSKLGIEAFPTFIVYKNKKEVWRKTGVVDAKELVAQLR